LLLSRRDCHQRMEHHQKQHGVDCHS
jgi:hypothetical protein